MKIGPRPILLLHGHEQLRDCLIKLAGKEFTLQTARDWSELTEMVRTAPPWAIAVVDPGRDQDETISRPFRSLIAEFPSLAVFAAVGLAGPYTARVAEMARVGVTDIITFGRDDSAQALRQRFQQVDGRSLKLLLERILPADLPGHARAIVEITAEVAASGGYIRDVARRLGVSRRTLLRWTTTYDLPPSRRLLAWLRLLQATQLLDDRGRSVQNVALACGYCSDTSLRRIAIAFLGESPTALRRRGAFRIASTAFTHALERVRCWRLRGEQHSNDGCAATADI